VGLNDPFSFVEECAKMKNKGILCVLVLAVIVGSLFFFGVLTPESAKSDMYITLYDADGNELQVASTTGLAAFGIRRDGDANDVFSVKVKVDFEVTTDIAFDNVDVRCYLEVETKLNTIMAGHVHTVDEHQMGFSSSMVGSIEATYLMSTLLPETAIENTGKTNGWKMYFRARVTAQLTLPDNTTRSVEDTCGITLTLTWSEQLDLESYIALP
jgi:hypothetical protein